MLSSIVSEMKKALDARQSCRERLRKGEEVMRLLICVAVLGFIFVAAAAQSPEAPTGFDNKTNGVVDQTTHATDQAAFEAALQIAEGLGPLYNAQSCRECHQNPTSGGLSQITELRVGMMARTAISKMQKFR